ncbi:hypothetical protein OF83DRAFT_1126172 [Amylostereum chailletii]|nr:hypothetical protein OF83DRAFT_1126172 [Amylostereum chailletii]
MAGTSLTPDIAYDPAFEWPGLSSGSPSPPPSAPPLPINRPTLRLLVNQSTVLSRRHRLAILDGISEVQLARDAAPACSDTPRIRLKELAVSKLHATIFWDETRHEWAVVDMGSKHGTFVASGEIEGQADLTGQASAGVRLSAPRVASVPRGLRHLDRLSIGGTTFLVHVHAEQLPCVECSASASDAGDEIPLFVKSNGEKRKRSEEGKEGHYSAPGMRGGRDAKRALTSLKREMLNRSDSALGVAADAGAMYVDRSARRRALHRTSALDTPGLTSIMHPPQAVVRQPPPPLRAAPPPPMRRPSPPRSAPSAPLAASNIGHRLLMKQGWQPGSALGLEEEDGGESTRLVEPLQPVSLARRAGLGMVEGKVKDADGSTALNWSEKRWRDTQLTHGR